MSGHFSLRKSLLEPLSPALWPAGYGLIPLSATQPYAVHKLLVDAYANGLGTVAAFEAWWNSLLADPEFAPELVFIVADARGAPVGMAQFWSGAFLKDIAIAADHRGRGVGEALLWTVFATFKARGARYVDLKVVNENADAQRLYARVGMVRTEI